jgi:hypothetical protein
MVLRSENAFWKKGKHFIKYHVMRKGSSSWFMTLSTILSFVTQSILGPGN